MVLTSIAGAGVYGFGLGKSVREGNAVGVIVSAVLLFLCTYAAGAFTVSLSEVVDAITVKRILDAIMTKRTADIK